MDMRKTPGLRATRRGAALLLAALLAPSALLAQAAPAGGARPLSLDEALRLAESASDQIAISRAGVTRARGEVMQARSQRFPQVNASASYTRALASEFQGFGGGGGEQGGEQPGGEQPAPQTCGTFTPNPALPIAERVDSLEAAFDCLQNQNPFANLGDLPFGRENTWRFGFDVSQSLFTGGRVGAQNRVADAGRRTAEIELASTRAQLVLDITQAYYDAALSDRLVAIAEATLQQAETTLSQTRLARQVGNQPEFDVLRAQVTYETQRPVVIQRRADRDLAYTRLALLLNLPPDQPLTLTTPLNDAAPVPVSRYTANQALLGDTTTALRAPVRQAEQAVRVQEGLLRVSKSQRLPQVSLFSQYARVGYPQGTFPTADDFNTNWNVGAQLSIPLFTGGRLRGEELVAQANLDEARARLEQTRTLTILDTRTALERLEAARASWEASSGTVEQAARAYQIAEIRYREGLSTQIELSDSRILLQQAEANRAQAARDLQIAQARVALLPDLPLNVGGSTAGAPQGAGQQQQQQRQQQQPRQQQPVQASSAGFTGAGVQ